MSGGLWQLLLIVIVLVYALWVSARLHALERKRRGQEERCQILFEQTRLGIVVFRPDCSLAWANDAMLELTGWSRPDLVGRKACSELLTAPDGDRRVCGAICPNYHRASEEAAGPARLLLQRRDGIEVPVMVSMAPMPVGEQRGEGFALYVWDISGQEQAEREVAKRRRQAEGLVAIGREIAAAPDVMGRLEPILERARDLLGMDLVAWGTLDAGTQTLTLESATGAGAYGLRRAHLALGDTPLGQTLLQGRAYITMEFAGDHADLPEIHALISRPLLRTAMAVPFPVREQSHGVLLCASLEHLSLTDEDAMLFAHLGGYLATAVENASLLAGIQHMATLEERQRLAGEMHDGFGQVLTYFGLRIHMIGKYAASGDTVAIQQEVSSLKSVLREAHTEVRTAIFRLQESAPPRALLSERWRNLLGDFGSHTGILVTYRPQQGVLDRLSERKEAQLTRILQEALVNVRNHSGAYSVQVRVERTEDELLLTVIDDGCGFDPAGARGVDRHHFGLTLMRERAERIGGCLELRSTRGHGTTVLVRCPVE